VEYVVTKSQGHDEFIDIPSSGNLVDREVTKMYWENREWVFKVNPFFTLFNPKTALFLKYGFGNRLSRYDENRFSQWEGRNHLFGLEMNWIRRIGSYGFFVDYRTLTFDGYTVSGGGYTGIDYKGRIISIGVKGAIGFGW
jgi:hypothetical protein